MERQETEVYHNNNYIELKMNRTYDICTQKRLPKKRIFGNPPKKGN